MNKRSSYKKSRRMFRGGFIRAPTPQFGNQITVPNPTHLNNQSVPTGCVSCQSAGARRRLSRRLRRRYFY
jgi:hypothetical protein